MRLASHDNFRISSTIPSLNKPDEKVAFFAAKRP
jgi:hypothetical protein